MGSLVLRIEVSSTSLRMELSMSDTKTISPLRQRMIEDMAARKLNPHTQRSHISSCKRFAAWLKRSPDTATADEVRRFQLHLIESGASICNRNRIMTGVRFLFRVTLRRHDLAAEVWHIKEPQKLPPVLSREEVKRVLIMATSLQARAMLTLAYGCGLRAGEVVRLRAGDIDSEQMIIRIVQSKGLKDRHVMLPAEVLDLLRQWWKTRPTAYDAGLAPEQRWLFPGRSNRRPLTTRQFGRLFKQAAKAAGLRKTLSLVCVLPPTILASVTSLSRRGLVRIATSISSPAATFFSMSPAVEYSIFSLFPEAASKAGANSCKAARIAPALSTFSSAPLASATNTLVAIAKVPASNRNACIIITPLLPAPSSSAVDKHGWRPSHEEARPAFRSATVTVISRSIH